MTYKVVLSPGAIRSLNKLPLRVVDAVLAFLEGSLAEKPHRVGNVLGDDLEGVHNARRGACRVLYEIDEDARSVIVTRVAHRAHIYRGP